MSDNSLVVLFQDGWNREKKNLLEYICLINNFLIWKILQFFLLELI